MFTLIAFLIVIVVALILAPVVRIGRSHTVMLVIRRLYEGRYAPAWLAWRIARVALKAPLNPHEMEVHASPGTILELRERSPEISLWLNRLTYWGTPPSLSWHDDGQPGRQVVLVPVSVRSPAPASAHRRTVPVVHVPSASSVADSESPTVHVSQAAEVDAEVPTVRRVVVGVAEPVVDEYYVGLEEGEWRIGRSSSCDLRLEDAHVSRLAATLRVERTGSLAIPRASGVLLNGTPLHRPERFRQDDVLTLAPGCVVVGRMMGRS